MSDANCSRKRTNQKKYYTKNYLTRGTLKPTIQITPEDWTVARSIAKKTGYTMQGWLGMLVRKAISEADGFDGNTSSQP